MINEEIMINNLDDLRWEVYLKGIEQVRFPFFQEDVKVLTLNEEEPSE
jgi:hypothetical protein